MFDAFKQQQTVTSIGTIGQAQLKEWEVSLGGIRFLPFDDSPAALAAMQQYIPYSYVTEVQPAPGRTGVAAATRMLVYDYTLWANDKVKDDVVTRVLQALHDHPQALKDTGVLWNDFDPRAMGKDLGIRYHPAAERFYKARGEWPGSR